MSKAVLIFKLPEEQTEFDAANRAMDYICAWETLLNKFRNKFKYENKKHLTQEQIYEIINDIQDEYDLK